MDLSVELEKQQTSTAILGDKKHIDIELVSSTGKNQLNKHTKATQFGLENGNDDHSCSCQWQSRTQSNSINIIRCSSNIKNTLRIIINTLHHITPHQQINKRKSVMSVTRVTLLESTTIIIIIIIASWLIESGEFISEYCV